MMSTVLLLALSLTALLAAQGLYYAVMYRGHRQRMELRRRLRQVAAPGAPSLLRERRMARSAGLDRLLRQLPGTERLEQLLEQSELGWTVATTLGLGLALGAGLGIALGLALRLPPPLLLLCLGPALVAGLAAPVGIALLSRSRRSHKISAQLPDALDMVVRSLRAGHGLAQGFKLVAEEMPLPLAMEFGRCFEEQRVGIDLREAVRHLAERVPGNLDLKIFAVSIIIQHETGGNLVEILEKIADTLRERFKFYGKLRGLTAEARLSGYILSALPAVVVAAVTALNPGYLDPLWGDPLGLWIIATGLSLWAIGGFLMHRLAQVDY
jgi:tight adherence protein B